MSDTFFSGAPHWTWFIILYFFVGGIAGGACFLAAVLDWFGGPEDRPVVRTGYNVAAVGAILSGALLTIDLGQPLRFWHMLFQSANFPAIMFKGWSPSSFGAWAILVFGFFSVLSALGGMAEEGGLQNPALRAVGGAVRGGSGLAKVVGGVAGLLGVFIAGYTGVLLSVTNRPIWADSPWLGALFVASGASTGAQWPVPRSSCCSAASCCDWPRSSRPRESTATASRRGCDRARPPRNRPLAAARRRGVRQPRGHAGSRGRPRGRPRQPRPRRPAARGRDDVLPDSLPHRESAMLWPLARPRRTRNVAVQERLAQARRDNPEAETWLGLLEAALDESEDGARWEAALPSVAADRPVKAPLLCRAQVRVDGRTVRTWVRHLLDLAPQVNGGRRDMDGLALLAAAVCQDDARSDALP